jgi:hypothetical protein
MYQEEAWQGRGKGGKKKERKKKEKEKNRLSILKIMIHKFYNLYYYWINENKIVIVI